MKVKSFCGQLLPNVPSDMAYPVALAQSMTAPSNVGFEVGKYLGYKETLCEVTAVTATQVQLVSWGWVPVAECTTEVER